MGIPRVVATASSYDGKEKWKMGEPHERGLGHGLDT